MLRRLVGIGAFLILTHLLSSSCPASSTDNVIVLRPDNFLEELSSRRSEDGRFHEGSHFVFTPGDYRLEPAAYVDSTCGNCEDPATPVEASVGLIVSGRDIVFEGQDARGAVLHTGAGYGLLFRDCEDCVLHRLTITGGARDPDPNATDAAVVVQDGAVRIEDCFITDNIGDSTLLATNIVGIIGIAGREGADLTIRRNKIHRNSWDGIALYRGARAVIERNTIDGVDKAGASTPGGGRGVAIGVTWNAEARIVGNHLRRYWKGIGLFVDAQGLVRKNIVEEMSTWGILLWDAGKGTPVGKIEGNIVVDTGACGIAITRESAEGPDPGHCIYNVVIRSGQNPKYDAPDYYCTQCPIAVEAKTEGFEIFGNVLYENRRMPWDAGWGFDDLDEKEFNHRLNELKPDLPVDFHVHLKEHLPAKH